MAGLAATALLAGGCSRVPAPLARKIMPGDVVYFVPVTNRMVALTFDDGPNEGVTTAILDTLKSNGVHATFFMLGANVERNPAIARRIIEEGHAIGNHSYSHQRFDQMQPAEIVKEIERGAAVIEKAAGTKPLLFRPPYGIDGTGTVEYCRQNGVTLAGWSADGNDWNPHTGREIADEICSQATPGDILLLHDGFETSPRPRRGPTVESVQIIVDRLKQRGFAFVTLPELIAQAGPPVAEFENGVRLLGWDLPTSLPLPQGESVYVRYFWDVPRKDGRPTATGTVKIELGETFSFDDNHELPPQEQVRQLPVKRVLTVPSAAPPGEYSIRIGLFDSTRSKGSRRIGITAAGEEKKNHVVLPAKLRVVVSGKSRAESK